MLERLQVGRGQDAAIVGVAATAATASRGRRVAAGQTVEPGRQSIVVTQNVTQQRGFPVYLATSRSSAMDPNLRLPAVPGAAEALGDSEPPLGEPPLSNLRPSLLDSSWKSKARL